MSKKKTITILSATFDSMMKKADAWDKLESQIAEFYDEENPKEGDLITIGEVAASAFGFL